LTSQAESHGNPWVSAAERRRGWRSVWGAMRLSPRRAPRQLSPRDTSGCGQTSSPASYADAIH
jgi:hypothetical protein